MKRAWITGGAGLIGSHLLNLAGECAPDWAPVGLTRRVLELTDQDAVTRRFEMDSPSLLIHCAAISNTRKCEEDPRAAYQVNVEVTGFLSDLFARARMVFFSTDLVFDGRRGHYTETDAPSPLGVYAHTKLEAEGRVLAHPCHLVLRTSINGGRSPTGNRGFNETMEEAWREGRTTPLFADEFRCPIPAVVTARATWELALREASGVYHLAGAERLSRLQIGELLAARHPELSPRIQAGSLKDYDGPPRAADCSLDCRKAQRLLSFPLPGLTEWLKTHPEEPF
jgi:dTDP-4-dehydrorhamnose reductase